MQNRIFFLSGLPRTGSTLLGSILNQNPHVHVSPTSPLHGLLVNTNERINLMNLQYTFDSRAIGDRVYRGIVEAFYPAERERPIVFDKHRSWPKHVDAIQELVDPEPRIICTVRPIAEIIASYITLANDDPSNFIDKHLRDMRESVSDEARAHLLWTHYLNDPTGDGNGPYECLRQGMQTHSENLLLIDYDKLCYRPEQALQEVYTFCGIDPFEHDIESIENTCAEAKDAAWGLKNLHTIRPRLGKTSVDPLTVLPQAAIDYFGQFDLTEVAAW